jgi:hypothetical protein
VAVSSSDGHAVSCEHVVPVAQISIAGSPGIRIRTRNVTAVVDVQRVDGRSRDVDGGVTAVPQHESADPAGAGVDVPPDDLAAIVKPRACIGLLGTSIVLKQPFW